MHCLKETSTKRLYKHNTENDKHVDIFGSNRWCALHGTSFKHYGRRYNLGQFMKVQGTAPEWMQEFDGYHSDGFTSGVLIKLNSTGEAVKAFTYIG